MSQEALTKEIELTHKLLSKGSMWDGYWIASFENGLLTIAASFDRIYRRDKELRFFNTHFFNLPANWADTDLKPVPETQWFRLSSYEELHAICGAQNNFPTDPTERPEDWPGYKPVFAFELKHQTAFVVASYFEAFDVVVGDGGAEYKDPAVGTVINRVPLLTTSGSPSPR